MDRRKGVDVDRLGINFTNQDTLEFLRDFRVVDHYESETYLVRGDVADNLSCGLCFTHHENKNNKPDCS